MKLICLQKNLQKGLGITERAVGKNVALPILENVLLEASNGSLKISSTNLEMGINCWVSAKVELEGSITIQARVLSGFINNLPNDKVFLESKKLAFEVKSLNYKAVINGEEVKDFPLIPKITGDPLITLDSDLFKEAFSQIISSASVSESRPEINGVFVRAMKDGKVIVAATDGFRLAEKTIKTNKIADEGTSFILPLRSIQELLRIFGERSGEVSIVLDKNQVLFGAEGDTDNPKTELVSRLIEGNFPNYNQLMPKEFVTSAIFKKEDLLKAVKISSVFSSKINDIRLSVSMSKGEINISAKDSESGENTSTVPAEVTGDDIEVAFNYKYIIDGLNSIIGDKVFMGFSGLSGPALMRSDEDKGYSYVVMPIRS